MKNSTSRVALAEIYAFSKAQVSAFLGGLVDYTLMILMSELMGVHYVWGVIVGGLIGAVTNFEINRRWTFRRTTKSTDRGQIMKFGLVVLGSISLKSLGTYCLTSFCNLDYRISRLITDAIVCFGFNYTLQRLWVFKKNQYHA